METNVLKVLGFDLGIPLSYRFLRRYARVRLPLFLVPLFIFQNRLNAILENLYPCFYLVALFACLQCAKLSLATLTLARYILESSLLEYSFVSESSSKMAAAALLLALKIKLLGGWTPTLQYYSGVICDLSKLSLQNTWHRFLES
jgi:cyclin B